MRRIDSPQDAFDLHTDYLSWRESHPDDDRLLHDGYWRSQNADAFTKVVTTQNLEQAMQESRSYHEVFRTLDDVTIARADTVFLSDELRELVKTAEATMPDEILFDTDVYTPCGFVTMETPITRTISARCLSESVEQIAMKVRKYGGKIEGSRLFAETEDGMYVGTEDCAIQAFSWADVRSITPVMLESLARQFGKESKEYRSAEETFKDIQGIHVRMYGNILSTTIDGLTMSVEALHRAPLRTIDSFIFLYGEDGFKQEQEYRDDYADEETNAVDEDSIQRRAENRRFVVALFRLMEDYVEVDKSRVTRSHTRRAERGGRGGDTNNITVLSLRREIRDEHGESLGGKVTLAHLVRGHWRNQWYPSQKMHRAKWIRAHRRGGNAGDTPVEKKRIIRVDR